MGADAICMLYYELYFMTTKLDRFIYLKWVCVCLRHGHTLKKKTYQTNVFIININKCIEYTSLFQFVLVFILQQLWSQQHFNLLTTRLRALAGRNSIIATPKFLSRRTRTISLIANSFIYATGEKLTSVCCGNYESIELPFIRIHHIKAISINFVACKYFCVNKTLVRF